MLQIYSSGQKLFAKSVPVTIQDGLSNQCRKCTLFLTVEWKEASAVVNKQELLFSLTDENDPFFLHHLHLSEEDFQTFKSSQRLKVDFTAFPEQFIGLMEMCLAEENKASPKFLLIFNTCDKVGSQSPISQLEVVESNNLNSVIHLTLKFIVATDSSVKQYLAATLKKLKEEKQHLESQLSHLEQDSRIRLSSSHASLEQKTAELQKLKNDLSVQLTLRETKYARELQEEREMLINKQREIEIRCESEKKEKDYNYSKELQQLEKRIQCLDTLNKEVKDQNRKKDIAIQDLKTHLATLEQEKQRYKDSLQGQKENNAELQSVIKQYKSEIETLKVRNEELDNNGKYLKQMLNKLQEQYECNRQHEKTIEYERAELEKELKECIKKIKSQKMDIDKGNEVISKLQDQIQMDRRELKGMGSQITKQQHIISTKDSALNLLQKELKDMHLCLEKKKVELKQLYSSLEFKDKSIKELEKEVKCREDVIRYLNRQLTDQGIIPQYAPFTNEEPLVAKRHSAGDAEINNLVECPTPAVVTNAKSSGRNGHSHRLQNTPGNNGTSPNHIPSGTVRNPSNSPDTNSRPHDLEIDSAALSAAFRDSDHLKHSTAKKFANSRGGKTVRGRINKWN